MQGDAVTDHADIIKRHIDSALNWYEVFEDGRGANDLTKQQTSEMLCRRLIAALGKDFFERTLPMEAAERLRKAMQQIITVCGDNAGPKAKHDMALREVGDVAKSALSRCNFH